MADCALDQARLTPVVAAMAMGAGLILGAPEVASAQQDDSAVFQGGPRGNASPVAVITGSTPPGSGMSRSDLRTRLDSLESIQMNRLDDEERSRVQYEIGRLERRLEHGDFRPGDLLLLNVEESPEMSGRLTVTSEREVVIPFVRESVSLGGIVYGEADSVLTEAVRAYVREPRVEVQPLIRVAILGAVQRPGFYDVAPDVALSELVMAAQPSGSGGSGGGPDLSGIEIRRGEREIWSNEQGDVAQITLAQAGVQASDEIHLPREGGFGWGDLRPVAYGLGAVVSIGSLLVGIF